MMRRLLTVCVLATLVGCDASAGRVQPSTLSEPTTASSTVIDPRPVLTMGSWPYAITDYWRPHDLADVYIYPDGTVIRVVLEGADTDAPRSLRAEQFTIDQTQLSDVISVARSAGLNGGGLQPTVPLPPGVQVQDGGATVFTFRDGDIETARAVDQLSSDGSYAVGVRLPFVQLLTALSPLCCVPRDDLTVQPLTRWGIVSVPGQGNEPYPEQEWTGPNLAGLTWVDIGHDVKCAIYVRADWPLALNERHLPLIMLNGRVITRRPLLPHEHDCNDVATTRDLLGLHPD